MYLCELGCQRYWLAPDRTCAGSPLMQHQFMVWQFCYSIINAGVPQEPPLGVVNQVAVPGKTDGDSDIDSWRPTRFVRTTTIAAVDHIEAVYTGFDLWVGHGGNSNRKNSGCQRQDGEHEGEFDFFVHELLYSKFDRVSNR